MPSSHPVLVHICPAADSAECRDQVEFRPLSLGNVGFVHLSAPQQVHLPANRLYSGRTDLLLLHIDPVRLASPLRWEPGVPTDPDSMLFPHLYGPLPINAVIKVSTFRPAADGRFLPIGSSAHQLP